MTLTIRPATDADAAAIWDMLRPVFRAGDTYAVDPAIEEAAALAYWTSHRAYLAEDAGRALGTFYIRPNQGGGGGHVANAGFVTAQDSERRGVARAMLEAALKEARRLGFEAMQFNFVLANNSRAIDTWLRAGFSEIGRVPRAYRMPDGACVDALILHRFL